MNSLTENLRKAATVQEKIKLLDAYPTVREFLKKSPNLLKGFSVECQAAGKQIIAIGQWERLVGGRALEKKSLRELLQKMCAVDAFYRELGGIVGYQEKVLKFLQGIEDARASEIAAFHAPSFIDIAQETDEVREAIAWGIAALPEMAEMYPLGGAADRLHLVDEQTGFELPAAKLAYAGRTLFEALIRDLAAREYLYFKLHGRQLETPVAIMTSAEKNNHRHVLSICEELHWFGRRKDLFRIFMQPLVPVVDPQGNWCLLGPFSPLLKPGGHGALWKLAYDEGIFEWLEGLGRKKALIRQLNNPIAALDYGLLAFSGFGVKHAMIFGFASCPRLLKSAEGVNVVVEKKNGEIALTNIEYCDFAKYGIEDRPLKEGEPYSRFSSNTNILFADLKAITEAVKICPFPGLLVNLKNAAYTTLSGEKRIEMMARLESTMQNIADVFVESAADLERRNGDHDRGQTWNFGGSQSGSGLDDREEDDIAVISPTKDRSMMGRYDGRENSKCDSDRGMATKRTFVTYNHRHKTIATAKKAFIPGRPVQETPEECFYVQLQSARDLLESCCRCKIPAKRSLPEYLEQGPDCIFLYHPALGPLYSIIAQKIAGGRLSLGSELQLEIADLQIENLDLEGSLLVQATHPIGHFDENGILRYSHRTGRCVLRNISVRNAGVDWESSSPYWKNCYQRKGSLQIRLNGFAEFIAENVSFSGTQTFEVSEGVRMRVREKNGNLLIEEERLDEKPFWIYELDERRGVLAARG